jgi:hypothetical protein
MTSCTYPVYNWSAGHPSSEGLAAEGKLIEVLGIHVEPVHKCPEVACFSNHLMNGNICCFLQLALGAMYGHHARVHGVNRRVVETKMVTVTQVETLTIMVNQPEHGQVHLTNSSALPAHARSCLPRFTYTTNEHNGRDNCQQEHR